MSMKIGKRFIFNELLHVLNCSIIADTALLALTRGANCVCHQFEYSDSHAQSPSLIWHCFAIPEWLDR